ncbi:MAG: hypothetical protein KBS70_06975 [Bacteroidales bacterium]|nr:hypothetical protein [Candidatus Colicola equi]
MMTKHAMVLTAVPYDDFKNDVHKRGVLSSDFGSKAIEIRDYHVQVYKLKTTGFSEVLYVFHFVSKAHPDHSFNTVFGGDIVGFTEKQLGTVAKHFLQAWVDSPRRPEKIEVLWDAEEIVLSSRIYMNDFPKEDPGAKARNSKKK